MTTATTSKIAQQITITRQNKNRSLIADFDSMTGITSDEQHVEFSRAMWAWINVDSGKRVEIGAGITWVTLETE